MVSQVGFVGQSSLGCMLVGRRGKLDVKENVCWCSCEHLGPVRAAGLESPSPAQEKTPHCVTSRSGHDDGK